MLDGGEGFEARFLGGQRHLDGCLRLDEGSRVGEDDSKLHEVTSSVMVQV